MNGRKKDEEIKERFEIDGIIVFKQEAACNVAERLVGTEMVIKDSSITSSFA